MKCLRAFDPCYGHNVIKAGTIITLDVLQRLKWNYETAAFEDYTGDICSPIEYRIKVGERNESMNFEIYDFQLKNHFTEIKGDKT